MAELAVFDHDRRLAAELGAGTDGRLGSGDPASRVNDDARRNAIGIDGFVHLHRKTGRGTGRLCLEGL